MSSLLPQDQKGVTQWILEQENEFRFEVGVDQSVSIEVTEDSSRECSCSLFADSMHRLCQERLNSLVVS